MGHPAFICINQIPVCGQTLIERLMGSAINDPTIFDIHDFVGESD